MTDHVTDLIDKHLEEFASTPTITARAFAVALAADLRAHDVKEFAAALLDDDTFSKEACHLFLARHDLIPTDEWVVTLTFNTTSQLDGSAIRAYIIDMFDDDTTLDARRSCRINDLTRLPPDRKPS